MLKVGYDLPVISFPQAELICRIAKPNRNCSLLIDSAAGKHSECRQIVRLVNGEL